MRIAVIGAGLGGLAAALALQRQGFTVSVYEQVAELGEVGAGITLHPNATKALNFLGIGDEIAANAVAVTRTAIKHFQTGAILVDQNKGDANLAKFGAHMYQTHRADLHRALENAVRANDPGCILTNHALSTFSDAGSHVELQFANGHQVTTDLLIGADGIKSVVRRAAFSPEPPRFMGRVAWRGVVPRDRVEDAVLQPGSAIFIGPDKTFGYYLLRSESYLAAWRDSRDRIGLAMVLIVISTIGGGLFIYRQLKRAQLNEQALRHAKVTAEEASEAKSRFLAHMSHEFRTPLNAIMGFSEIIKTKVLGEGVSPIYVSYADHIHKSGEHLLKIVNDILDMAKIESGAQPIAREPVDVSGAVESAVSFVEGLADQKRLHIRVLMPAQLPRINGNERLIRQIVINLLSNAIKFSPRSAEIEVSARHSDDGPLEIAIADRGPGIETSILRRIGEPFLQGNPSISRSGQGTGLGLSICKNYLNLMGGELVIDSTFGAGTTAVVRFPPFLLVPRAQGAHSSAAA